MATATVTRDDRRLLSQLEGAARRASNMAAVMPAIGNILVADAQLSFRESRNPWGQPWAPLKPTTLMMRAARRTGGNPWRRDGKLKKAAAQIIASSKPLLDTGRLRNSLTFRVEGNSVVVGTNVRYGSTHQWGAKRGQFRKGKRPTPWGDVPARQFLPMHTQGGPLDLPPHVRSQIVDLMVKHLLGR